MRATFLVTATLAVFTAGAAGDFGTLVFHEDFERNGSQALREEPGNGWGTNSRARERQ